MTDNVKRPNALIVPFEQPGQTKRPLPGKLTITGKGKTRTRLWGRTKDKAIYLWLGRSVVALSIVVMAMLLVGTVLFARKIQPAMLIHEEGTVYVSCTKAKRAGSNDSLIYLSPDLGPRFVVGCEQEIKGGGWTIIQRRSSGAMDFNKTWAEYKAGFGRPFKNYWIGNENLYRITNAEKQLLLILFETADGTYEALYELFFVSKESDKYFAMIGDFIQGNAGESFEGLSHHHFSTYDKDNDMLENITCASKYGGGWWYTKEPECGNVFLNAPWGEQLRWQLSEDQQLYPTNMVIMMRGVKL